MKKTLFVLLVGGLAIAADSAASLTTTPGRTGGGLEKLYAIIKAQAATIEMQAATITRLETELAAREACEALGFIRIPGHASADGSGCVDPANF